MNRRTDRVAVLQLAVRLCIGAALIYLAYPETGPWTTVVLALMLLGVEGNSFLISKQIELEKART